VTRPSALRGVGSLRLPLRARLGEESGYTLVELIVTMLLITLLSGVFYSFLFSGDRVSREGRRWLELNETARLTLERMTRELREADALLSVSSPNGSSSITFQGDFNADGTFVNGTYNARITCDEVITYRYDSAGDRLLVSTAVDPSPPTASPTECVANPSGEEVLAENVASFALSYFGSNPYLDNGTAPPTKVSDGSVTWQEMDKASAFGVAGYGNNDGVLNVELDHVTSIAMEMTVALGSQEHPYRTAIELRNTFS
jgi:prepilin-type N-terminal cleavage/methylation domain-containing protein